MSHHPDSGSKHSGKGRGGHYISFEPPGCPYLAYDQFSEGVCIHNYDAPGCCRPEYCYVLLKGGGYF